ncbi:MAG TPA: hypothetical protein VMM37_10120, partial [Bacteroidota bacterium]|nr:hypothetical protein [Bacteroidota bacterium]
MNKIVVVVQGVVQLIVGFSSFVSGILMIVFPSGKVFQAPPDMLNGSPFRDFLIPGIILMSVNGVGQLGAGILTFRHHPSAGLVGAVFGLGLVIWIFVQVNMIGGGNALQYCYFALGVIETALSFLIQSGAGQ